MPEKLLEHTIGKEVTWLLIHDYIVICFQTIFCILGILRLKIGHVRFKTSMKVIVQFSDRVVAIHKFELNLNSSDHDELSIRNFVNNNR